MTIKPLAVTTRPNGHLNCPRCGLSIRPRTRWLTIDHCPRCLARHRIAVQMFSSPLAASDLYEDGCEPHVIDARRARSGGG